ncbi:MAG TPA: U32 family peptidase [Clostridia bacterium]|nr:U32 family peptidase [Clostridia bacterium]
MSRKFNKPELLAPAGDMECLEAVVRFGADAVYIGGAEFGMRTASKNFDDESLRKAVEHSHKNGVKVYLACNTVPRNDEIERLPRFIEYAAQCGVDAFIVTDIGVLEIIKKYAPHCDVHISTQAGITNYSAANAFFQLGASRVVTARELSIDEIAEIREKTPNEMEIECFIHGAMCVSFSGRCLLSNYLTGRDANRGDCAQPCRWKYRIVEEKRPNEYFPIGEDNDGTYIFNAKDMCMINHIPQLVNAGISSFKIEGRAKSAYYVSVVTNAYRCAIDSYFENLSEDFEIEPWIVDEMFKISHRDYCTGFYFGNPKESANVFDEGCYRRYWDVCAVTLESDGEFVTAQQRNKFFDGDELEVLEPMTKPYTIMVEGLCSMHEEQLDSVPHPKMIFKFKCNKKIPPNSILRKKRK